MPEHWALDFVPVNETHPMRPVSDLTYDPEADADDVQEDPYSLSKLACEEQAAAVCRYYPGTRVASIRMHFTRSSINDTTASVKHTGLWSWSSVDAVLRACVLALTSEGWSGAEAFHIASDEIFYPASLSDGREVPALDVLEKHWPGRVKRIDRSWWKENPRRSFFDTSKAQSVLGWKHDL
jgi:nucleoside-diphosphate-sugar epimerase